MSYPYFLTAGIATYRLIVIVGLIVWDAFDPHYFTYINYTLVSLSLLLYMLSMRSVTLFHLASRFLIPVIYGTTLYVAIAITVIVYLNDWMLTRNSYLNGGGMSIGKLNTGNILVHYLPVIDVLLVLLMSFDYLKAAIKPFFYSLSSKRKILYALYVLLGPFAVLVLYMVNFDFAKNYPTGLATWELLLITLFVNLFTEMLLILGLLLGEHNVQKESRTPIHAWYQSGAVTSQAHLHSG